MKRHQDDDIESVGDPYREQLERTLAIIEQETIVAAQARAELRAMEQQHQLLNQSCIEQRNVIRDLKTQLQEMLTKETRDEAIATDETNADIQRALDVLRPFKDQYQDLYPCLSKLVVQDVLASGEAEYDQSTVDKILAEAAGIEWGEPRKLEDSASSNQLSISNDGLENSVSPQPRNNSYIEDKSMSEEDSKKKPFDWGIFKKLTGGNKEKEKSVSSPKWPETPRKDKSDLTKIQKEWEQIQSQLKKGDSVWSLNSKIDAIFKSGSYIPQKYRGAIWSRMLGNRSRVTPRIYNMLLAQLPKANPDVKTCIVKDVERSFSYLSRSQTLQKIKRDAIKILQLFEVARCN